MRNNKDYSIGDTLVISDIRYSIIDITHNDTGASVYVLKDENNNYSFASSVLLDNLDTRLS